MVILKGHKQLIMDVLRLIYFLSKFFNFTETLLFLKNLGWLEEKSKNEMH